MICDLFKYDNSWRIYIIYVTVYICMYVSVYHLCLCLSFYLPIATLTYLSTYLASLFPVYFPVLQKLSDLSNRIQRVEIMMSILEAKVTCTLYCAISGLEISYG